MLECFDSDWTLFRVLSLFGEMYDPFREDNAAESADPTSPSEFTVSGQTCLFCDLRLALTGHSHPWLEKGY